jgi:phosphoribosylanthranilate isomerase
VTWVKVCGLSRPAEVAAAVDAGADAVGFVAINASPRFVEIDRVAELAADVPVRRVLLTSGLTPAELLAAAERTGVDAVQPYGAHAEAAAATAAEAGMFVLQPIRMGPGRARFEIIAGAVPLFDTHRDGRDGGTGESFDWHLLDGQSGDFVVAGGLGPDNVASLVAAVGPWGVDASSRLESTPGIKDLGKVAAFVEEAKRA